MQAWLVMMTACSGSGEPASSEAPAGAEEAKVVTGPPMRIPELAATVDENVGKVVQVAARFRANAVGDAHIRVILYDELPDEGQLDCYTKHARAFRGLDTGTELIVQGTVADRKERPRLTECVRVDDPSAE